MEEKRVHLYSKQGIYTVVSTTDTHVIITCNRWNALANYPDKLVTKIVPLSDIKCKAGLPGDKKRRQQMQNLGVLFNLIKNS